MKIPIRSKKGSIPNECFENVGNSIKQEGGHIKYGWALWETPFLIEGEFHAVWENSHGELIDVSPQNDEIKEILFLPDSKTEYKGLSIDNIRLNISGNQLVNDFILLFEIRFKLLNAGNLKYHHGKVSVPLILMEMFEGVQAMISSGANRNSFCFCGSNKKFKHCHGNMLEKRPGTLTAYPIE